ncbi:hypothetical protein [Streptomyces sp. NPDC001568]|uniref:hypothetical protein n=1 Tax=Streptomyces sp. NPDC001568 TaxID=3364588 RepID=UPI0036C60AA6
MAGTSFSGTGVRRGLITAAVWIVLLTAASAFRRRWQHYAGAWVFVPRTTRWLRGLLVLLLVTCLTSGLRAVPDFPGGVLLCAAGAGMAGWLLWSKKPTGR